MNYSFNCIFRMARTRERAAGGNGNTTTGGRRHRHRNSENGYLFTFIINIVKSNFNFKFKSSSSGLILKFTSNFTASKSCIFRSRNRRAPRNNFRFHPSIRVDTCKPIILINNTFNLSMN